MDLIIKTIETVLISGVTLLGNFMPFAAGVIEKEEDYKIKYFLYVLSFISVGLRFSWLTALSYGTSVALFIAMIKVMSFIGWRRNKDILFYLFVAGLINTIIWNVNGGLLIYDWLVGILKGAAMVTGYLIYTKIEFNRSKFTEKEFLISVGFIGLILMGLKDIRVFSIDVKNVFCICIVLSIAASAGMKFSTVAGLLLGAMCELTAPNMGVSIISFGLGGFIAGLFKDRSSLLQIWGFVFGNSILAYYITGYNSLVMKMFEIALAGSIFFVIQKKYKGEAKIFEFSQMPLLDTGYGKYNDFALETLTTSSERFDAVTDILSDIDVENEEDDIFDNVKDNICFSCDKYNFCWDEEYEKTTNEVFNVIEELQDTGKISKDTDKMFLEHGKCKNREKILDEISFRYNKYLAKRSGIPAEGLKECVKSQLKGFSQYLTQIKNRIADEPKTIEERIIKAFEAKNILIDEVNLIMMEREYEISLVTNEVQRLNFLFMASNILSGILKRRMIVSERKKNLIVFKEQERLKVLSAVITKAASGESILGDSYKVEDEVNDKFVSVLSDGMGTGEMAQKVSSSVVDLFVEMNKTGLNSEVTTNMLSSFMQYISNTEKIITLDALSIDLFSGECEFFKVGGAPSFIIRRGGVEIINSDTLPMGIFEKVDFFREKRTLERGDIVVSVSDGVIDSKRDVVNKEFWVSGFLNAIYIDEPEVIAEELLHKTVENYGGKVMDDVTIIVAKVE